MATLMEQRHQHWPALLWDLYGARDIDAWFDAMSPAFTTEDRLRIEQEVTEDEMVVRAEMPGIDPDRDVEITVAGGMLHIRAERRSETTEEADGRRWSEFRYGSFSRTIRVPKDTSRDDVTATYKDGVLEVRFPYRTPVVAEPQKVAVTRE